MNKNIIIIIHTLISIYRLKGTLVVIDHSQVSVSSGVISRNEPKFTV